MNKIKLSKRLHKASEFAVFDQPIADIGSDHAYLPIYLVQEKNVRKAIAGEVAEGPYQNAMSKVAQYGLENQVSIRLGDGLNVLKPADVVGTIFICGMGGSLIATILNNGLKNKQLPPAARLVLQPNNAETDLRKWLAEAGYEMIEESILEENDKIYEIIVAESTEHSVTYSEKELLFGPKLLEERSNTFIKKWEAEKRKLENILEQLERTDNIEQIKQFEEKLKQIEQVMS